MAQANKGIPVRKPGMKISVWHILIVVVVIVIAYFAISSIYLNPVHQLSAQQSFTINKNSTIFYTFLGNSIIYGIFLKNSTPSSATFYISELPVLTKPIVALTILGGASANISSTAGSVADVHIALSSSTSSQATFTILPLLQGLGLKVNGNIYIISPPSAGAGPSSNSGNVISTATTTASTTIGSSTTTVSTVNVNAQVLAGVNSTSIGKLMSKYKALYIKDTQCTPGVYNSTYLSKFGSLPPAPNSFINVTTFTPTDISISISKIATNVYNVTYSIVSPSSETTGPAAVVEYSLASNSIVTSKFEGNVYGGQTQAQLNSTYALQAGFNNNCGAYIS